MESTDKTLTPSEVRNLAGKYLTFALKGELFGFDVLKVREIIRNTCLTPIPCVPDYVRGVINLRGKIIPVTDLRLRFGYQKAAATDSTCIIMVQVSQRKTKRVEMGLIVDGVEDVINIGAEEIEETPDFGGSVSTECILGMAKVKGKVITLLDIDRAITVSQPAQV